MTELKHENRQIVLLGCGFTAGRVAFRLLQRNARLLVTTRQPENLTSLAIQGVQVERLDLADPASLHSVGALIEPDALVLHSIPLVQSGNKELSDPTGQLLEMLGERPARLVYISTTGVYGPARQVNETTQVAPGSPRESLRVVAEKAVLAGNWSALVLRPAAIYGPGQGVQESIRNGRYRLAGDGTNFISRIYVDDLAAHCEAGLLQSGVSGAYPVADEEPCSALEMAEYCAKLLAAPMPPFIPQSEAPETLRSDRRVDGQAIRRVLGLRLAYPSYRQGVPAALGLPISENPR